MQKEKYGTVSVQIDHDGLSDDLFSCAPHVAKHRGRIVLRHLDHTRSGRGLAVDVGFARQSIANGLMRKRGAVKGVAATKNHHERGDYGDRHLSHVAPL